MEVDHDTAIVFESFNVGIGYPDNDSDGGPFVALALEDEAGARVTLALSPNAALKLAEKLVRRVQSGPWKARARL